MIGLASFASHTFAADDAPDGVTARIVCKCKCGTGSYMDDEMTLEKPIGGCGNLNTTDCENPKVGGAELNSSP